MQCKDYTKEIIMYLKNNGCNATLITSFLRNNINFILNINNLLDKIYFIYNNNEIYAILIADNDYYYWSICEDNISYPLLKNKDNNDYIIEMIINYISANKFKGIIPNTNDMNVESKVKILKNTRLNTNGYHIK